MRYNALCLQRLYVCRKRLVRIFGGRVIAGRGKVEVNRRQRIRAGYGRVALEVKGQIKTFALAMIAQRCELAFAGFVSKHSISLMPM